MPTAEEVKMASKALWNEIFIEPNRKYLSGIAQTTLGALNVDVSAERRDELCIWLLLTEELPADIAFPTSYQGIVVVSEVTGRAYALSAE